MRKRSLILTLVAVAALAAVPFVYAQGFHGHRGARGEGSAMFFPGHIGHLKAALNLSDAQVDQLKAIRLELKTQNDPYRQQLRAGFQSAAQALLANPNDLSAAQAQLDQQLAVERTMKLNALTAISKALNVLTPEQRATAAQLLAERQSRHQQQK